MAEQALRVCSSILVFIIVAEYLSLSQFYEYSVINRAYVVFITIILFGLEPVLLRNLLEQKAGLNLTQVTKFRIGVFALLTCIIVFAFTAMALLYDFRVNILMSLSILLICSFLEAFSGFREALFANNKYAVIFKTALLAHAVQLFAIFLLVRYQLLSLETVFLCLLGNKVVFFTLYLKAVVKLRANQTREVSTINWHEISTSLPVSIAQIVLMIYVSQGLFLLSYFDGETATTSHSIAAMYVISAMVAPTIVSNMMLKYFLQSRGKTKKRNLLQEIFNMIFLFSIICVILLFALFEITFSIFFDDRFIYAQKIFYIYIFSLVPLFFNNFINKLLLQRRLHGLILKRALFVLVLHISLSIILLRTFGPLSIALAYCMTEACLIGINYVDRRTVIFAKLTLRSISLWKLTASAQSLLRISGSRVY